MAGHDIITPEGERFFQEIKKLTDLEVRVGYERGKASYKSRKKGGKGGKSKKTAKSNEIDVTDVAVWNEFGTDGPHPVPSRPFLRKSVDENLDKITDFGGKMVRRLAKGASAEDILQKTGRMQKGLIRDQIDNGDFAANSPYTIRKKKSDHPLIDTGKLRRSVSVAVEKKGGGK